MNNVTLLPLTRLITGELALSQLRPPRIVSRAVFAGYWCDHPRTVVVAGEPVLAYGFPFAGWYIASETL